MIDLTFLEADRPLVKTYSLGPKGDLEKESYPRVWEFTSHKEQVENITDFASALARHAVLGHCLLKGNVNRPLVAESRAGSTDPNAPTSFVVFDLDRSGAVKSVEEALQLLGFSDVSHVVQYSASHGIEQSKGVTAHIGIFLSEPLSPASLKQWLIGLNLNVPWLRGLLTLTKTNNAISWPLDVSTCQNDKLLYIAPPILGEGVRSTFNEQRIQAVHRHYDVLDVHRVLVPTAEQNRITSGQALNVLRAGSGLSERKWATRTDRASGLEVLIRPDISTLTGIKTERGFTYFNLNGGDSWGYYHSAEAPEVIRNFKGENNYLTSELLPEYWEQVLQAQRKGRAAAREAKQSEGLTVLAFRDFKSATYYNGTYDNISGALALARATSETQLQHYLAEHGQPGLESIPIWDLVYEPSNSGHRIDAVNKRVNVYAPSAFSRVSDGGAHASWEDGDSLSGRCPSIAALLDSAVGRSPGLIDAHLGWTACLFRHRCRTMMSWCLQGVEGTGKGIWVNKVLIPLLGRSNVAVKRMAELEDAFNGYIEHSILVVVDEAEISESHKSKMIMANLKHQITEPEVSIRKMYTASYSAPNYCNFLFLSNMAAPVVIGATDRRFNCGEYGHAKFEPDTGFFERLEAELPAFAAYLYWREADLVKARTIFESPDRDLMKATSTNSLETTAQELLKGNLEFFWDSLPAGEMGLLGIESQALSDSYVRLIHEALRTQDSVQRLTRDEVRVLIAYNVGEVSRTPAKFTSLLRHHRIALEPMRISGRLVRGLAVNWKVDAAWKQERLLELQDKAPALRVVK